MGKKIRDDVKPMTIAGCGIFTVLALVLDFTASNIATMQTWLMTLEIIGHVFLVICWIVVLVNMYDPDFDKWRKICIAVAVACALGVLGDRATRVVGAKMMQETIQQTKQQ